MSRRFRCTTFFAGKAVPMPAKPPRPARPQAGLRTQKRTHQPTTTHEYTHTHTHRCLRIRAQARMTTHTQFRRFPFYAKTGDGKRLPRCWTFVFGHDSLLNRGGFQGGEAYAGALGGEAGGLQVTMRKMRPKKQSGHLAPTPQHAHTKQTQHATHTCATLQLTYSRTH